MQTSAHISPCSPAKHGTSFRCFFLKTIVDCCGFTLSLSLSTTTILNVPLIFNQAKEFEIVFLFLEVLSWNTLHFGAQLTATTCSCYCHLPCFLYNKMFSRPLGKKSMRYPAVYRRTHRQTDRHLPPPAPLSGIVGVAIMALHHQTTWFHYHIHLPQPLELCCHLFPQRTHATFLQTTGIVIGCPLWRTIRQEFIYLFIYLFITLFAKV